MASQLASQIFMVYEQEASEFPPDRNETEQVHRPKGVLYLGDKSTGLVS